MFSPTTPGLSEVEWLWVGRFFLPPVGTAFSSTSGAVGFRCFAVVVTATV